MIAKAVANETDANFVSISGPEIMSKFYGNQRSTSARYSKKQKRPLLLSFS